MIHDIISFVDEHRRWTQDDARLQTQERHLTLLGAYLKTHQAKKLSDGTENLFLSSGVANQGGEPKLMACTSVETACSCLLA
ncbi:hypothetical protein WAI453_001693 [Rhynchosporium graminicola]